MNTKRIFSIILTLLLVFAISVLFVACGDGDDDNGANDGTNNGGENNNGGNNACDICVDADRNLLCDVCGGNVPCTDHRDENADNKCDFCEADFNRICRNHVNENGNGRCDICGEKVKIEVSLTVSDLDGNPMAALSVTLENADDYDAPYELMTNEAGKVNVSLYEGEYKVSLISIPDEGPIPEGALPEWHLPYGVLEKDGTYGGMKITVESAGQNFDVKVKNNEPNGEIDRPYPIDSEMNSVNLPANETVYYIVYHSYGKFVKFDGDDFIVVYNGAEYIPEGGTVTINLVDPDPDKNDTGETNSFHIKNLSAENNEVLMDYFALPGTQSNPIVIEELGDVAVSVTDVEAAVYYTYIATATGKITVAYESAEMSMSITNTSTSNQISSDEFDVNEGEVFSIVIVASATGDYSFNISFAENA